MCRDDLLADAPRTVYASGANMVGGGSCDLVQCLLLCCLVVFRLHFVLVGKTACGACFAHRQPFAFSSLSNVFLLLSFNRHWDAYILQFLSETNARESSEFVHTFILSYHTLGLVVFYALFIAAELGG